MHRALRLLSLATLLVLLITPGYSGAINCSQGSSEKCTTTAGHEADESTPKSPGTGHTKPPAADSTAAVPRDTTDEFTRNIRQAPNHNFMRFGRGDDVQHQFMRFGRGSAVGQHNFMRFGREPMHNFMRFGRAANPGHQFMRFGRQVTDSDSDTSVATESPNDDLENVKIALWLTKNLPQVDSEWQDIGQDGDISDDEYQSLWQNDDSSAESTTDISTEPFERDAKDVGHNFMRFGREPGHNFMRFGRAAPGHNFMRFGRLPEHNFLRFGRNPNHNFMRFGREPGHNFMRFGRQPDHNFMRFGRVAAMGHNFMRFGRSAPGHNFMRFGRDQIEESNSTEPSNGTDEDTGVLDKDGVKRAMEHSFMRFGRK